MKSNRITQILAAGALACGLSLTAYAQIGSGWTSTNETFKVQTSGSGTVNGNIFSIPTTTSGTKDRAEREYNTWSTGTHQFQGDCTVKSFGGNGICVKQTFQANDGPWNMVAVQNSGNIYEVSNGQSLGSFTVGTSFRINTILDADAGTVQVYVNGTLAETLTGGQVPIYDKCGTYRIDSGTAPITAAWSNVVFWIGGSSSSGLTGTYQIENVASDLSLNVSNNLTSNGAPIVQYSYSGSANEKWTFTPTSNGYYQIVNVNSGKDVAVQGASTANEAKIVQWTFGSSGDDQWKPVQNSNGSYTFYNLNSGKVLDNPGSSTTKNTQMDQYTAQGGANQQWDLISH
jgi:hypothetical protein